MIFQLNLRRWRCWFWTKSSTRVIGTLHSPFTTWLLPEVVPSYGRLNEYYCFNICLSLHDTFVRINCLELDGRLAWWRAALTIFTSYVNWNYYKLHPRCFFGPLWRLQLGGCAGRGHSEAWGGASFVWLCPVPENLICLRSICQTPDTAAQCPPGPPKSQSKPKWVTCQPHQSLFFIIGKYWAEPSFRKRWWHWW